MEITSVKGDEEMNTNWELFPHIGFSILLFVVLLYLLKQVICFLNRLRDNDSVVEEKSLQIGDQAPLFRSNDQHHRPISMNDLKGKHTIMIFSSSTCSTPCRTI